MSPGHKYTDSESLEQLDRIVWEHVDRIPKAGDLAYNDSSLEIMKSDQEGYWTFADSETEIEVSDKWLMDLESSR